MLIASINSFNNSIKGNDEKLENDYKKSNYISSEGNDFITKFISSTNPKSFVEEEVKKNFKNMMQRSSTKEIYDILFAQDLKKQMSYKQFDGYNINSFGIDYVDSIKFGNSIIITFKDITSNTLYSVTVEEGKITQFKQNIN